MGILSFCIGGVVGFASGFLLGVDYGRRHSEPWKDLGETAVDFAAWAKSTLKPSPAPATDSSSASTAAPAPKP